jgi:hypothetical protein
LIKALSKTRNLWNFEITYYLCVWRWPQTILWFKSACIEFCEKVVSSAEITKQKLIQALRLLTKLKSRWIGFTSIAAAVGERPLAPWLLHIYIEYVALKNICVSAWRTWDQKTEQKLIIFTQGNGKCTVFFKVYTSAAYTKETDGWRRPRPARPTRLSALWRHGSFRWFCNKRRAPLG